MRASQLFMPTLKEDPSDAEAVSHKLLVRGGFVRQFASGIYIFLPLGKRVMDRVNRIIREEMDAIGAQEVSMPTLHPGRGVAADRTLLRHRLRRCSASRIARRPGHGAGHDPRGGLHLAGRP